AIGVVGEERTPVERKQPLGKPLELRAVARLEACRQGVEGPGIDPDVAPVEGQLALVQDDRAILAEELAQAVKRARERAMRRIAIDARPERVDDARFAHFLAAVRDEELQQLERAALRLAAATEDLAVPLDTEGAQGVDAEHPRPGFHRSFRDEPARLRATGRPATTRGNAGSRTGGRSRDPGAAPSVPGARGHARAPCRQRRAGR